MNPACGTNRPAWAFLNGIVPEDLPSTNTAITFINQPIVGEISDLGAHSLPTTYVPATVNLLGVCTYALNTNAAAVVSSIERSSSWRSASMKSITKNG